MEEEKPVTKLKDVSDKIIYVRKKPIQLRAVEIPHRVKIETREGTLYGEEGDYLLEGIDFEVYPVGKSIFFRTYDILNGDEEKEPVPPFRYPDEERVEKHKENVEREFKATKDEEIPDVPPDKEELILAQIYKKDGKVSIRHSKSASQFEIFGFLTAYLEAFANDLVGSFEPSEDFELY